MRMRRWLLAGALLLFAVSAGASTRESGKVLLAYGPGGPHHALQECAQLFQRRHGIAVAVFKASPRELERKLREDGDLYFGGAEYMLEEFARLNPGVLDLGTVEKLAPRRVGIVVRKGNPLSLKGVACLQRDDVDLLDVQLENMARFLPAPRQGGMSVARRRVYTGQEGVAAWRSFPELDAWVTYRSWHFDLREETEFIEIPGRDGLRYTPVALTRSSPNRREALQFIAFLKSPEAQGILAEHGWE